VGFELAGLNKSALPTPKAMMLAAESICRHAEAAHKTVLLPQPANPHGNQGSGRGQFHNFYRTWHRNGQQVEELRYRHGLLHGVSREWNENGRLLGSFTMVHGTGIQPLLA